MLSVIYRPSIRLINMMVNRPEQGISDLVSLNIRGAVSALAMFLDQQDILRAWLRAGFSVPADLDGLTLSSAWTRDREEIHDTMSAAVEWRDPAQSTAGLRALSTITSMAKNRQGFTDDFDDNFFVYYEEVRRACNEDGFELDDNGKIAQTDVVTLEDLDVTGLDTMEGVLREVKKLNQAITRDQDFSDVIGHSKSLVEAVSAAIMDAHGAAATTSRGMKVLERTSEVHRLLGINPDDLSAGGAAVALNDIKKGLNRLVQALDHLRNNNSDAGHANHTVPDVKPEDAQLAVDCALAWCRYVLAIQARRTPEAPF